MKRWGKLWLNPQTRAWVVKGRWQGKRQYFSEIPTVGGGWLVCRSKEMAEHLQHLISIESERGSFNPARFRKAKPLHTGNYARKWLEDQKPAVKFSTRRCYRAYIDLWIDPLLGKEYLPDISHEKIKRFLNAIPKSPKYKKNIQALLFEILRDARDNGYLSQVPALIPIKIEQKKIKHLDAETRQAVLEKIPARHRPIYAFLFATGCRVSEARALRKTDVKRDCIVIAGTFAPSADGGEAWQIVKQSREEAVPLTEGARLAIEAAG
jgi:integrase